MRRLFFVIVALCIEAAACSWDYLIWTKSPESDTALFRFVTNETRLCGTD